jgi:predicted phosphodiesterase
MQMHFDLISDLHIETWPDFDWTGQPTSPYCVVAGDVAQDSKLVYHTLDHLGQCYQGVFYIDGNDEHRYQLNDLGSSYRDLDRILGNIKNVVYMQDNVVIINGVALLATNGWWSYDFDSTLDYDQSVAWYQEKNNLLEDQATSIGGIAFNDAAYMINSVKKLQTHQDVRAIAMITHTVPTPLLINHDPDLVDTWRFNCMGNRHTHLALQEDTEHKIKIWCFGHYHKSVDRIINGVRYVNNCRGRGDTPWNQSAYYPKRITVDF